MSVSMARTVTIAMNVGFEASMVTIAMSVSMTRAITIAMSISMTRAVTIAMNVDFNGQGGHDSHEDFYG